MFATWAVAVEAESLISSLRIITEVLRLSNEHGALRKRTGTLWRSPERDLAIVSGKVTAEPPREALRQNDSGHVTQPEPYLSHHPPLPLHIEVVLIVVVQVRVKRGLRRLLGGPADGGERESLAA